MIVTHVILFLISLVTWLLTLVAFPAAPLFMTDAVNGVIGFLSIPIGLFRTILGDQFFVAVIGLLVAYVLMFPVLRIGLWVYKLIRGG